MVSRLLLCLPFLATTLLADPTPELLWKGTPPGKSPAIKPDAPATGRQMNPTEISDVATPTLTWFRPEKPDGRALIVVPGGAYKFLAVHKEGVLVAQKFVKEGITVAVLHYRVPTENRDDTDAGPRHDIAEALRQVRADQAAKGLKGRIGVVGFSAGGHLVLQAGYGKMPEGSPRPDFVIAVYPAYITEENGTLKDEFTITKDSPPICFFHSRNDPYPADGSVQFWKKAHDVGVQAELHIYSSGGHGFGMTPEDRTRPTSLWPDTAISWLLGLK